MKNLLIEGLPEWRGFRVGDHIEACLNDEVWHPGVLKGINRHWGAPGMILVIAIVKLTDGTRTESGRSTFGVHFDFLRHVQRAGTPGQHKTHERQTV